ncbi:LuxR C-terminal-related transcriptional regulator [Kitasatospora sp. NPDC093806]|uniref:LuxR C-terminal-related transcriptional regulator n=1 Tax=Kitasatospora sp. NPDC093806 TaxID=3155075 RepID=UPI00341FC1B7
MDTAPPRAVSLPAACPCSTVRRADLHTPRDLAALTDRESDVLLLLGTGLGNLPIARHLGITERTVKKHVTSILGKLDLRSRLEAGLLANLQHDRLCPPRTPAETCGGTRAADRSQRPEAGSVARTR